MCNIESLKSFINRIPKYYYDRNPVIAMDNSMCGWLFETSCLLRFNSNINGVVLAVWQLISCYFGLESLGEVLRIKISKKYLNKCSILALDDLSLREVCCKLKHETALSCY